MKEEREHEMKLILKTKDNSGCREEIEKAEKRYFAAFDGALDKFTEGPLWLKDERVASVVADAIRFRDGKEYDLEAYCIMPNHVHMVFHVGRESSRPTSGGRRTSSPYMLVDILRDLKWYTAKEANKILERTGAFWQHESYDHAVRNEQELGRVVAYVLNNPVKAGFVDKPRDWKWSYSKTPL